jgi:hypothetical protein
MWRTGGAGEAYIYADKSAQSTGFCDDKSMCRSYGNFGYSIGRGAFTFPRGRWSRIKQIIKLNGVDELGNYQRNGIFRLYVDGEKKIDLEGIAFRTNASVGAVGIDFTTFFGGGSDIYKTTKNEFTFFKNMRLSSYWVNGEYY